MYPKHVEYMYVFNYIHIDGGREVYEDLLDPRGASTTPRAGEVKIQPGGARGARFEKPMFFSPGKVWMLYAEKNEER